mgnify:CR=1 FL=1
MRRLSFSGSGQRCALSHFSSLCAVLAAGSVSYQRLLRSIAAGASGAAGSKNTLSPEQQDHVRAQMDSLQQDQQKSLAQAKSDSDKLKQLQQQGGMPSSSSSSSSDSNNADDDVTAAHKDFQSLLNHAQQSLDAANGNSNGNGNGNADSSAAASCPTNSDPYQHLMHSIDDVLSRAKPQIGSGELRVSAGLSLCVQFAPSILIHC